MEIISYIQEPRKRNATRFFKSTIGVFPRPKHQNFRKSHDVSYSFTYPAQRHTFTAGKVKNPVTAKTVFAAIWKGVSAIGNFICKNIKTILITVIVMAFFAVAAFYGLKVVNFKMSHLGQVVLNSEDKIDFENLDKFMSSFALDVNSEIDAEGNLLDADFVVPAGIITEAVSYQNYKVKSGDTISGISKKFGLKNISTLISVNDISNVRQLVAGQKLKIPSMDGIVYTVKKGDSIKAITEKFGIKMETLLDINELVSEDLTVGQVLFIPGAALDRNTLQNAMGELFIIPIAASFRWTSPYGWREDPFTGVRSFHTGTDMACPQGTPILASQSGRVSTVGYNRIYGNYIIIDHGNGYQTLYAHQYKTIAKKGQWVSQGTKIGLVGSTGYSTGPHLHLMVYKNGNRIDPMTVLKK